LMTRVLVTGASGFVGRFVMSELQRRGVEPVAVLRRRSPGGDEANVCLDASSPLEAMRAALQGADAVIHLAAAVHDMSGRTTEADFLRVNRDYPLRLATAAAQANVPRFVFASTIKVNGDGTGAGQSFSELSPVAPKGAYAESKWQAEEGLRELSAKAALQTRIVRPPLVYGPGVRANFHNLIRLVKSGVPLPFGSVQNARSLVYVENLADLLARLALDASSGPATQTYLVADGEDLSTPELIRRLAQKLNRPARLLNVPELALRRVFSALRRREFAERLLGSLRVDSARVRAELPWQAPVSVDDGLARTVGWFSGRA
jgi:nucleoside-diphosphate-sugar epimerase